MKKVQIDNVKMWESIIPRLNNVEDGAYKTFIIDALQDQGLEYKDGHIISITKPNAVFKIKKGKWYVCTKPFLGFYVGDLGYCDCDGDISHSPNATERYHVVNTDCFRPATEKEIKRNNGGISPKFKVGDIIRRRDKVGCYPLEKEILKIEEGKYVFTHMLKWIRIEDQDEYELVESKQTPDTRDEAYYYIKSLKAGEAPIVR